MNKTSLNTPGKSSFSYWLSHWKSADSMDLLFIAGPCVIESETTTLQIGEKLAELSNRHSVPIVFKASFDKANRTSAGAFRGPGIQGGLNILEKVRNATGLPVITDIHESNQAASVANVADILQIPALLCRQTDLLMAAAATGKPVNIKKGQFLSPGDMLHTIQKTGNNGMITERGTSFGYNRLVVDFSGIETLKSFGRPVLFDATHSVQTPGGGNGCSSGNRALALPLARAAVATGIDGLFFEIHPDPDHALCDGPNSLRLDDFEKEVPKLLALHNFINEQQQNNGQ